MLSRRLFFRVGAATWITGGIGHFVLIDALTNLADSMAYYALC